MLIFQPVDEVDFVPVRVFLTLPSLRRFLRLHPLTPSIVGMSTHSVDGDDAATLAHLRQAIPEPFGHTLPQALDILMAAGLR